MTGDVPHGPSTPPSARERSGWLASLAQRFVTAFILMPVIIVLVWFGGWVAFAAAVIVLALCLWELRAMLAKRGWHPPIFLSALLGLDFLVAAMLPTYRVPIAALGISALVVGSFAWLMLQRRVSLEGALIDWALTMAVAFYVGWPIAFFLLLRSETAGYHSHGFWWTLTLFFTVWSFDTAAFFSGRFWGRTKLAPLISPKKTWEGVAGGVALALVAAWIFTRPLGVPWYHVLALGALVSAAATAGDLAESLLKREVGAKDSGTLMHGHGGVLDRVDSLLFAVMVVFFYAAFLHSIPAGP